MIDAFRALCAARGIVADASQQSAAQRLQQLSDELIAFKQARRSGLRKLLFQPALPRSIYFWGGVGRGKSLLMDCFFNSLPYRRKRRVHFHAFMREVHQGLRQHKGEDGSLPRDPLLRVAERIGRETRLLCFDEFHVSDIADAMILGRLLEALLERGVVFCMTSNYAPDGLYPDGLQRGNFLPAIELLKQKFDVIEVDGGIDYRLRTLEKIDIYLTPADAAAEQRMADDFALITGERGAPGNIEVLERKLSVRRGAPGVIWFDFATLCGGPRSQNDYLDLACRFHTVFLSGVPRMTPEQAAEARRFTWLIDVFYEYKVKLILSAECEAENLYREGLGANEFSRTVSRLIEMRSHDYLAAPHRGGE